MQGVMKKYGIVVMNKILALFLLALSNASFSCEKFSTEFDKNYCYAKKFFTSDSNLNIAYGQFQFYIGEKERRDFKSEQRSWLKTRNSSCTLDFNGKSNIDWKCASDFTDDRINFMNSTVHECILKGCNLVEKSPPARFKSNNNDYIVEYLNDSNIINVTSSARFGRKAGESCMRFVGKNDSEYLFSINSVSSIRILDYVSIMDMDSWPKKFERRSDIPRVRVMVINKNGSTEVHEMYATLFLSFMGLDNDLLSIHPGRIVHVWFPISSEITHANGINC